MHLQSAHIQHYKSLGDVTVEFATPITVVVGPNGAGKSNLADCLRFVRDGVVDNLEHAVTKRGGIGRVRQNSFAQPPQVSIRLEFLQEFESHSPEPASYSFAIKSLEDSNYKVESERAEYSWVESRPRVGADGLMIDVDCELHGGHHFQRDNSGKIDTSEDTLGLAFSVGSDRLALAQDFGFATMGAPLVEFISRWRYSALYPNTLKDLSRADKNTSLTEDGTNWASVVKALLKSSEGRDALDRINEAMRAVIPKYKDVTVSAVGSYLVPWFRFEAGEQTVEFDPPQLSDGTLRVFGILLALYQQPPASLLVIEEPEQSVHPGALAVLVDSMREVSEVTQIIVTTHSPQLVDLFKPEEIRVATMQDGRTHITPIAKSQIKAVKQRLMSLADFMQAEGLQPDLEP